MVLCHAMGFALASLIFRLDDLTAPPIALSHETRSPTLVLLLLLRLEIKDHTMSQIHHASNPPRISNASTQLTMLTMLTINVHDLIMLTNPARQFADPHLPHFCFSNGNHGTL